MPDKKPKKKVVAKKKGPKGSVSLGLLLPPGGLPGMTPGGPTGGKRKKGY